MAHSSTDADEIVVIEEHFLFDFSSQTGLNSRFSYAIL
jgi:hypothetical protein